jgi:septation ring formation regulator EzrA
MSQTLEELDNLINEIESAVVVRDWEGVGNSIATVKEHVEAVMRDLDRGEVSYSLVQNRLARLNAMCDRAEQGAESSKAEALATLKGLSRNRNAARSYEDVSVRRSRD